MNDLELLLHQTRHVYGWLTSATADADFAAACFGRGERPSIAWLTGHMLVQAEATAEAVRGLARSVSDRCDEAHFGCQEPADWNDLRASWVSRSAHCLGELEQLEPGDLDRAPLVELLPKFEVSLADRRRFWSGHVFHMGYHLGQLGSLRAELGLGWWQA